MENSLDVNGLTMTTSQGSLSGKSEAATLLPSDSDSENDCELEELKTQLSEQKRLLDAEKRRVKKSEKEVRKLQLRVEIENTKKEVKALQKKGGHSTRENTIKGSGAVIGGDVDGNVSVKHAEVMARDIVNCEWENEICISIYPQTPKFKCLKCLLHCWLGYLDGTLKDKVSVWVEKVMERNKYTGQECKTTVVVEVTDSVFLEAVRSFLHLEETTVKRERETGGFDLPAITRQKDFIEQSTHEKSERKNVVLSVTFKCLRCLLLCWLDYIDDHLEDKLSKWAKNLRKRETSTGQQWKKKVNLEVNNAVFLEAATSLLQPEEDNLIVPRTNSETLLGRNSSRMDTVDTVEPSTSQGFGGMSLGETSTSTSQEFSGEGSYMKDPGETLQPGTSTGAPFQAKSVIPPAAKTAQTTSLKSKKGNRKHIIGGNVIGRGGVIAGHISGNVSVQFAVKMDPEKESERYQKLCKVSEEHVRTTLYYKVLDRLDNTESVTVLGNAGDGKTTLLHLICLEYSTRGYLTIQIDRPEDIDKYLDTDKPVLFFCDSFLGRLSINSSKKESWISSDCEKLKSDKVKVLFACRIELWGEHEKQLKQNPMFKETVDVRSEKLTDQDKTEMISKHFGNKISRYTKELIVRRSNFAFPECCRFVSHSRDIDFSDTWKLVQTFNNPYRFVMTTIETIKTNNIRQYATLVLCLLNKRKLPTSTSDIVKQPNFEMVRKLYLSGRTCSVEQMYDELLDKATEMDGWLLTQIGDYYVFYHDSIFEAVCRVHGARYPEHILNFFEPKSVFTVCTTKPLSGLDRVFLSPRCYPKLVEIVTVECVNERWFDSEAWRFVFAEMDGADILKQWHRFLLQVLSGVSQVSDITVTNPTLADVILLMTELPASKLTVDGFCVLAAKHGETETPRLLVDSGVTRYRKGYVLQWAAGEGHVDIVRIIVKRGDLDTEDVKRGLERAVECERVECVREILRVPGIVIETIHRILDEAAMCDSVHCLRELMKTNIDTDRIPRLLKWTVIQDSVNCLCELMKKDIDIDTDTIHRLLKKAVWWVSVKTVTELVKHQAVSRDYVQILLDTEDSELFVPGTSQSDRDEIRQLLSAHLNTDI